MGLAVRFQESEGQCDLFGGQVPAGQVKCPRPPQEAKSLPRTRHTPRTRTRASDPETSQMAAAVVCGDPEALTEKQRKVLDVIFSAGAAGLTDEELTATCARLHGWGHGSTARTRRAELAELSLVEVARGEEGEEIRRTISSGGMGRVWRVTK